MPDTFYSGDAPQQNASFAGLNFPMSPTELVDRMVNAVQSTVNEKGDIISKPAAVKALQPLIGHYTVADAAMALALLHGALAVWPTTTDDDDDCPRFNTLCHVSWLLETFVCFAEASGPLCVTGRLYLLERAAADDAWALPNPEKAMWLVRHDTRKLCRGRFARQTFGGFEKSSGAPSWLCSALSDKESIDFDELNELFGIPTPPED